MGNHQVMSGDAKYGTSPKPVMYTRGACATNRVKLAVRGCYVGTRSRIERTPLCEEGFLHFLFFISDILLFILTLPGLFNFNGLPKPSQETLAYVFVKKHR